MKTLCNEISDEEKMRRSYSGASECEQTRPRDVNVVSERLRQE